MLTQTNRLFPCGVCREVTGMRLGRHSPVPCCSDECMEVLLSQIPQEEQD